jgi:hypothetical protein
VRRSAEYRGTGETVRTAAAAVAFSPLAEAFPVVLLEGVLLSGCAAVVSLVPPCGEDGG